MSPQIKLEIAQRTELRPRLFAAEAAKRAHKIPNAKPRIMTIMINVPDARGIKKQHHGKEASSKTNAV